MAVLKGIKEKVHLPLYDSVFVRPNRQLREIESSSVLKFFVNVQGKTKLETNMQSAAMLPHWSTFEARALRVVVSDLTPVFPDEVQRCIAPANGSGPTNGSPALRGCIERLTALIGENAPVIDEQLISETRKRARDFERAIREIEKINADFGGCIGIMKILADPKKITPILKLQGELRAIRGQLVDLIARTGIALSSEVKSFAEKLKQLSDAKDEDNLLLQIKDVNLCADAFKSLVDVIGRFPASHFSPAQALSDQAERVAEADRTRRERLRGVKECFDEAAAQTAKPPAPAGQPRTAAIEKCLKETLGDKLKAPIQEQITGNAIQIFAKLLYNSATTFFVGEKAMIQMPTWFFPAGAGPFSDGGPAVTHGFPAPEATFRFAEPVFIDTRQNFRVEIEIPESVALDEIQRIYGPFFIWAVLDGYMNRDVQ